MESINKLRMRHKQGGRTIVKTILFMQRSYVLTLSASLLYRWHSFKDQVERVRGFQQIEGAWNQHKASVSCQNYSCPSAG